MQELRSGLAASVQYTLAKATDNAAAFAGVNLNGGVVAQNWRDLDAELAPSNFDQRHLVTAQFQYTSGVGVAGGALIDGLKGALLKGWTVTSQLTTGSGLPFTPVYLAPGCWKTPVRPLNQSTPLSKKEKPSSENFRLTMLYRSICRRRKWSRRIPNCLSGSLGSIATS